MGAKITIDSASFSQRAGDDRGALAFLTWKWGALEVIVHPQSIVHFHGGICGRLGAGAALALGHVFPIQYAVTWPERVANTLRPLNLRSWRSSISRRRHQDSRPLNLAEAGRRDRRHPSRRDERGQRSGGRRLFYRGKSPSRHLELVEKVMNEHRAVAHAGLDVILDADLWARQRAGELI